MDARIALVLRAAAAGGLLGGAPSTAWAVITGADPLASTTAAGQILLPGRSGTRSLLVAGTAVHCALSVGWSCVLVALLPRRHTVPAGAAAGLAIAALDLSIARTCAPAVAALPTAPQVADHITFGVLVALVRRAARPPVPAERRCSAALSRVSAGRLR